ncbi:MAG: efflux RND transporter periplasmic adaptor subunit [Paramuribaculum sp.]|nr:efflux RND transporter periplasmic adaptor subunit [Paramuribaculum sp.]
MRGLQYKNLKVTGFVLTVAVLIGCCGCKKEKKSDDSYAMPIDVAEVVTDSIVIYKDYPGTLRSTMIVDIVGRVNGYLRSHNYTYGDMVRQGQVLFTIEDTQYRNAVEQARAQLETAKSTCEYNTKQYEAMKKAFEKNAVSEMEVIQAKSNYEESLASIKNAEAALKTAQMNLSYCTIKAPFTGRVSTATITEGGYVGGENSPVTLATIYDNSEFYADFYVDDASYLRLNSTQSGAFKLDYDSIPVKFNEPYPHVYKGVLSYMAPDIDTGTGTMLIRVKLTNKQDELRDGMYTTISLPAETKRDAILIKDASIGTDQLGKYVYVVNDSNKVVYTTIKVGDLVHDSLRVVNSGLKPGDRYVTKALLKVKNGEVVKPVLTK